MAEMDELGCSRATLYRDIAFLRDALGAPIESGEGEETSVRYAGDEGERFELPGLWLTSEELAALLALNELIPADAVIDAYESLRSGGVYGHFSDGPTTPLKEPAPADPLEQPRRPSRPQPRPGPRRRHRPA